MRNLWFLGIVATMACSVHDPSDPLALIAPTVDEDPSLEALEVNGTRLHVEMMGPVDAPVIVFLHGGPGGDFRYMLDLGAAGTPDSLVADHRLVFWDQRGTGLSRRHPRTEISMEAYLADLEALVDAVSPARPVILVGHSWGGAYAAWYTARHPERVRGLVMIDPQALTHSLYVAHGTPLETDLLAEWLDDPLWAREIVSPADHVRADFLLASTELFRIPRFGNDAIAPMFRPGSVVFRELALTWFDEHDYDFATGLAAFPRPVLILAGTDDRVLGYEFQQRQLPLFGDAQLIALPGDGHNDPVSGSASRTVTEIRSYLATLEVQP
jgi:proline iminopeptidase